MKTIDLNKTVYNLIKEYPEIRQLLHDIGFTEISKDIMLNSVGRIMTIPKGAKNKKISLNKVIKILEENGFEVINIPETEEVSEEVIVSSPLDNNTNKIKDYLLRLNNGESLEKVRADFVKEFEDVEASEIMKAEQEILAEGTPLEEVQKLCDIHSALFHGVTREEKIVNAEIAVAESLKKEKENNKLNVMINTVGHPLNTFTKENEALEKVLQDINTLLENNEDVYDTLSKAKDITIHYAKKGDLLYPLLKVNYDISGPSNVMWTVDGEIRDELSKLLKSEVRDEEWIKRVQDVVKRMEEMIYKESNILYPITAENFTEEDWINIYKDSKDYNPCLEIENLTWTVGEEAPEKADNTLTTSETVLSGGHLTPEQLTAMLNTLPIEITFIDEENINQYFNEGHKVFKRPVMALGREVFECHPPKVQAIVKGILDDFKNGNRDSVQIWMEKEGKPFLVNYMAVRDKDGKYLGTAEFVQDMSFAKEHFSK